MSRTGLKFAMVTTFYPPFNFGGDGIYVRRLAHALARRGHSVDVIHDVDAYLIGGGREHSSLEEPEGVRTFPLRSRFPLLSTLATQQSGRPMIHGQRIREILSAGYDVIHFHNISLVGGPGVLACGDAIKLYTAHEHWLVCPTHILWKFNREPCQKAECLRCVLAARRPPQLWRNGSLLREQGRHVDEFLALSEFSAQQHRKFGFEFPMTVFPSFLPDEEELATRSESPSSAAHAASRPYFLFVGRLEPIKGLEDVIPIFDDAMPAELWIAGTGGQEASLRELAKGRNNVRFLGNQTSEQLRGLYRNAVALVASSRCFEVFPLVLLEAFKESTPVVARKLGPYPEILLGADAGLLFEDNASLRAALLRLLQDASLRARLGGNGAQALRERWSEEVVLERYFGLIEKHARRRGLKDTLDRLAALDDQVPA